MPKVMCRSTRRAPPLRAQQQQDSTRTNGTKLSGSSQWQDLMSLNLRNHSTVTGSQCFLTASIFFVIVAELPRPWMKLKLLSTSLLRASIAQRTPRTTTENRLLRWAHESQCWPHRPNRISQRFGKGIDCIWIHGKDHLHHERQEARILRLHSPDTRGRGSNDNHRHYPRV